MTELGPTEIVEIIGGGGGVLGALWLAVKWLGGRQVSQLDETIKKLEATTTALAVSVQGLRESNIKIAEQLGGLAVGLAQNKERINEASAFWREAHKELAERVTLLERTRGRK